MYQLDDLGLARASVRIVFSSVKRRSIQKLQHPPPPLPPPPSPKTPRAFVQIPPGPKLLLKCRIRWQIFLQKTRSVDVTLL